MDRRFEGRVVIITGAGGGLGRAAAERFAREGASIVAVDLEEGPLDEVRGLVEAHGCEILLATGDVTRSDDVRSYVAGAVRRFGGVDALFNNAGIEGAVAPVDEYPEEVFDQVMAVNVKGVFLNIKHVVPVLRQRGGGAIVNTASVAGLAGAPAIPAYGASKHAVVGLTRAAAVRYANEDIRVNAICPGPTETRMMRSLEDSLRDAGTEDPRAQISAGIPQSRYATPHEVAALVAFLCSDDAAYINGATYTIDGAMTAG